MKKKIVILVIVVLVVVGGIVAIKYLPKAKAVTVEQVDTPIVAPVVPPVEAPPAVE